MLNNMADIFFGCDRFVATLSKLESFMYSGAV